MKPILRFPSRIRASSGNSIVVPGRAGPTTAAARLVHPASETVFRRPFAVVAAALIALAMGVEALAQGPTNDMFLSRIPLEVLSFSVTSTNALATREADEPRHRGLDPVRSLWWRWTAPLDGYVVVDSTNSPSRTRAAVYDLRKQLNLLSPEVLQSESGLSVALDHYEFDAVKGRDYNLAVDSQEGDSGAIQLDLRTYTKPEMFRQAPVYLDVNAGARASLDFRVLGKRPLTNQWQFSTLSPNTGFTNLAAATGRVLDIGTDGIVTSANEGWYRAVTRNEYGAVTSRVSQVFVNECALPIAIQPLAVSNNVGKTVAFSASALGTPPLLYQWQFKPSHEWVFSDLTGATSSNLVLTNISTDDAGDYRFLVSNVACTNQASTNATLIVGVTNALIIDTNYPANLTRITNESAEFTVRILEGYRPIRQQWWFRPKGGTARLLSGETATNLYLPGVRLTDEGSYWAALTNRYAVTNSRQAYLTVETRPTNDNFEMRIPAFPAWTNLPRASVSQTNLYAWNKNGTSEPGELPHQGRPAQLSLWWSLQAPVEGHAIVSLKTSPAGGGVLAAYTGDSVSNLVVVPNLTNRTDMVEFIATTNVEYLFAVEAASGSYKSNNVELDVTFDPNLGAPTMLLDLEFNMFMLGGLFGFEDGCLTFDAFVVQATSLDGVVNYQWQFGSSTNGPWIDLGGMTNSTLVIENVTTANEGWYRAKVSNRTTTVYSKSAYLNVGLGPVISLQPKSVSTNACTSARFEVQAASCSPMAYQWYQNSLPVTAPNAIGVHSNILIINDLGPSNAGDYYLAISNAHALVLSSNVTLTVTNTPQIRIQPQSVRKRGCETATISVDARHDCLLSYQWFFEAQPLAGATNNTLVLTNLDAVNAGNYFVVISTPFASVTPDASVTSTVALLTVQTNPVITQHPRSTSVHSCDVFDLEVRTEPEPACSWLDYQWQHASTNIPGATGRVYSSPDAAAEHAGEYRVIVANRWTSVTSGVATVTVDARPIIAKQPAPYQRVREGDAFTNQVIMTNICGSLDYTWQYKPLGGSDFTNVLLSPRITLDSSGWLLVANARTNDSGFYRAVITNMFAGATSAVAQIRVVRPPANDHFANAFSLGRAQAAAATGHNEYATREDGEPAHGLQPAAHSVWWSWTNPAPSLVTVDLAGSDIDTTLGVYTGMSVSNLTTLAQDDDGGADKRSRVSFMAGAAKVLHFAVDGKRDAEGTNLVLALTSDPIVSPPVIIEHPLSLAATAGQTVSFTNRAWGSPDMAIWWMAKGEPRPGAATTYPPLTPTNYLSVLTLTNVSLLDEGVYYAVLSNQFGMATSKLATLTFGSIVRGMVTDATKTTTNGVAVGIPDVRVSVGDVWTMTDADGNYELVGVKIGELRADFLANKTHVHLGEDVQFWDRSTLTAALLEATKDGFYDYIDDRFEVGQGRTVAKRFSMAPIFKGIRFVLNWTNDPPDLDLLLHIPPSVPVDYHWIDYLNRGSTNEPPFAILDADMQRSWGPETISVHRTYPGTYSLYARKYPGYGGNTLAQSFAQVATYRGDDAVSGPSPGLRPLAVLDVPTLGPEDYWYICDFDGSTTNVTWINQLLATDPRGITNSPPGAALASTLRPPSRAGLMGSPPIAVDYEWTFGDSNVSALPAPVHPYAEPGWKTVSLTVTERIGASPKSSSVTKTNYIYVENLPPVVAIINPLPNTIFRAGTPITLESEADGVDDPMKEVEYYLQEGERRTLLGTVREPPYTWVFPNADYVDTTYTFVALARDQHDATSWSEPVTVSVRDLRGDILILRNFASIEIDTMVLYLGDLEIPDKDSEGSTYYRPPVVKVLDQEGLYFGLVEGFKAVIWDDQGAVEQGLTDNDVAVLQQAYDANIPLYLIGERLGESRDWLLDLSSFYQWSDLLGFERVSTVPGPVVIQGLKADYRDGLFYGWYRDKEAGMSLPYSGSVERVDLATLEMEVVAEVPVPDAATNCPVMLRYPAFGQRDLGQTRRLVQNFRVTGDKTPVPPEDDASSDDRRVLFINGVAWLLRLFECQELNVALTCLSPPPIDDAVPDSQGRIPSGRAGQPMLFVTRVTQNGSCTAGGILVTNHLSPRLVPVSAEVVPAVEWAPTNTYEIEIATNTVIARFAQLPRNVVYELRTMATPRFGGWITNEYTVIRGLFEGTPCQQVAFIEGPACLGPLQMAILLDPYRGLSLEIAGANGCLLQLQSSTDLLQWQPLLQLEPDADPYTVSIGHPSGTARYYRIATLN